MKLSFALCALTLFGCNFNAVAAPATVATAPVARGYTVVSGLSLSFERTKYKPGETAQGTVTLSGQGTDKKPVTVSGGVVPGAFSLAPGESQSVSVKLSETPGNYDFVARCEGKESKATLTVVGKTWKPQPDIEGAELKVPEKAQVGPGGSVYVEVGDARDTDTWTYDVGDAQLNQSGTAADEIKSYTWTCSGGGFYVGDNPDGTPKLQATVEGQKAIWWAWSSPGTVSLTCAIEDKPLAIATGEGGSRDDAALKRAVTVEVLPVQLLVRRKGSGNEFAPSARVAAGGKSSPEQQADVIVKVEGDKDVSIGKVCIVKGDEKGHDDGNATLDMSGTTGTFTSSNYVSKNVSLRLEAGEGSLGATVSQVWDNAPLWKGRSYFTYGEELKISFSPRFTVEDSENPPVAIKSQQVAFKKTKMVIFLWDKDSGDYKSYDFSPTIAKWDIVQELAQFSPSTASSGSGEYNTSLSVTYDAQRVVDQVSYRAVGLSVWEQ